MFRRSFCFKFERATLKSLSIKGLEPMLFFFLVALRHAVLFSGFLSIILLPTTPSWAQVGDRLLVSINSTPYSQRQMECYFAIKEGLREGGAPIPALSEASWSQAITAFTDDMIIHQEAHRVGSFQASESTLKVAQTKIERRKSADPVFSATASRLGIDERTFQRTIHTVLRTEAFRRNKERQSIVARSDDEGAPRWFEEIKDRAVVRYFSGASKYLEIKPSHPGN